jgi:hypothetical protein
VSDKCEKENFGINILDLEKALKYSWAKQINSDRKIEADSDAYKNELEKILKTKEEHYRALASLNK